MTVIKKAFDALISGLDTTEESLSLRIYQWKLLKEEQRVKKNGRKWERIYRGTTTKAVSYPQGEQQRENGERKGGGARDDDLPHAVKHQTPAPSSENIKENQYQNKITARRMIFKLQKIKYKES